MVLTGTALGNRLWALINSEVTGLGVVPVDEFEQDRKTPPAFYINPK
jgi:hypothetical protein